ncbi:hypothetical protein LX36DRAFT_19502 [Colletotrichum falcatum]|nr:hypothetical protein LX36DRAFT_19502 [Colletotrichum falcatum]
MYVRDFSCYNVIHCRQAPCSDCAKPGSHDALSKPSRILHGHVSSVRGGNLILILILIFLVQVLWPRDPDCFRPRLPLLASARRDQAATKPRSTVTPTAWIPGPSRTIAVRLQ